MYQDLQDSKHNLAHAYLIIDEQASAQKAVLHFLHNDLGVEVKTNPNLYLFESPHFTIDQARTVTEKQLKTSLGSDSQNIFIISFATINFEAQNALLKTLEEPTEGTLIFLITPSVDQILPTILSRVQTIYGSQNNDLSELSQSFISSDYQEREKIISTFLPNIKKNIPANKQGAYKFVSEILALLHQRRDGVAEHTRIYREIESLQNYLLDRSSSVKYILEYIAIRLPQL